MHQHTASAHLRRHLGSDCILCEGYVGARVKGFPPPVLVCKWLLVLNDAPAQTEQGGGGQKVRTAEESGSFFGQL